jgi:hypothetical protein
MALVAAALLSLPCCCCCCCCCCCIVNHFCLSPVPPRPATMLTGITSFSCCYCRRCCLIHSPPLLPYPPLHSTHPPTHVPTPTPTTATPPPHAPTCRGQSIKVFSQLLRKAKQQACSVHSQNLPHIQYIHDWMRLLWLLTCGYPLPAAAAAAAAANTNTGVSPSRCSVSCCARPSSGATYCPLRREGDPAQGTAWPMREQRCWTQR